MACTQEAAQSFIPEGCLNRLGLVDTLGANTPASEGLLWVGLRAVGSRLKQAICPKELTGRAREIANQMTNGTAMASRIELGPVARLVPYEKKASRQTI